MIGDSELIKQLNFLKNIKPGDIWKSRNRDILREQVYASNPLKPAEPARVKGFFSAFLALPALMAKKVTQPVMAVVLIFLFMAGSGVIGQQASRNTKPGDSMYIAKIISEKTQFALTFGDKEKARLGIEFAGNRAEELNQVLKENSGEREEQAAELVNNFKKEISAVKTRLERISRKAWGETAANQAGKDSASGAGTTTAGGDETAVFSANLGKDEKGLSIAEPAAPPASSAASAVPGVSAPQAASSTATTTPADAGPAAIMKPADILKQAVRSLANDNYDTAFTKLDEAVDAINQVDTTSATTTEPGVSGAGAVEEEGEVLGATATGTVEILPEKATSTD